jgi:hypothetical protein
MIIRRRRRGTSVNWFICWDEKIKGRNWFGEGLCILGLKKRKQGNFFKEFFLLELKLPFP